MKLVVGSTALGLCAVAVLLIGLGAGAWWSHRVDANKAVPMVAARTETSAEPKVLYWYDPMVPDQRFDKPGKSPFMDMQLVPKYASDNAPANGVRIDAGLQQNVGIRTAVVAMGRLANHVTVPATVTWDLREESIVSARVDGTITRLNIKAPFEPVRRGQPLAKLLAPAWASAAAEAQALSHANSAAARDLQSAAQQRLRVLGIAGGAGADGSVVLRSPSTGVVSEVLVREGQSVISGTPLFRINGTATLWLEAAIPQASTGGIRPGTPIEATVSALPGRTFRGEVEALLPQVEIANRTQRARIVLHNDDGLLVPGMFALLSIGGNEGNAVPLVPDEAIVATGVDTRVIVLNADGSFQPTSVTLGRTGGGRTEILSGLKGGERIVTSGQFLIDSEASLSGALDRMQTPAPDAKSATPEGSPP